MDMMLRAFAEENQHNAGGGYSLGSSRVHDVHPSIEPEMVQQHLPRKERMTRAVSSSSSSVPSNSCCDDEVVRNSSNKILRQVSTESMDTTNLPPKKRRHSDQPPLKKKRKILPKRVRFAELLEIHEYKDSSEPQTLPDSSDTTSVATSPCWYTRRELWSIKQTARLACANLNIDDELRIAFQSCCCLGSSNSTGNNDNDVDNDVVPTDIQEHFLRMHHNNWDNDEHNEEETSHRGLERWASREHYRNRVLYLLACKTDLFIEQSSQVLNNGRDHNKLAEIYKRRSQVASTFARYLGHADQAIAQRINNNNNVESG